MFLFLAATVAIAEPCPTLEPLVAEAWDAYLEAEFDVAKAATARAQGALGCQSRIVAPGALLELYWLEALVALSEGDTTASMKALQQSVAVDHRPEAHPTVKYGPELRDIWESVASAASQSLVTVSVEGTRPAWVDGRWIDGSGSIQVAPGLHLVQTRPGREVRSRVERIVYDQTIVTTGPGMASPEALTSPEVQRAPRHRPPVLYIATVGAGAISAWALASGVRSENAFSGSAYRAASYEGCALGQACYEDARQQAIRSDAAAINRTFGIGYGMAAVTSGLLTITIAGLPAKRREQ